MPIYRKKPVEIEAQEFQPETLPLPFREHGVCCYADGEWFIQTLEGRLMLTPGDMVIRGVKGEFYPCKPDIFAATYEPVDEPERGAWQPDYVRAEGGPPARRELLEALAALPDEAFGWFVAWSQGAAVAFPPGLGGFSPESQAAVEQLREAARAFRSGPDGVR